jgi:hypothetical protein
MKEKTNQKTKKVFLMVVLFLVVQPPLPRIFVAL